MYEPYEPVEVEILEMKGYYFLWIDDILTMCDVPQEDKAQANIAKQAFGHVLVAGYGLGVVQKHLLANPRVKSVWTTEKYTKVVRECKKVLGVIHGQTTICDFFEFETNQRFDCVIGDIWQDQGVESLDIYTRFKEKARSLLKPNGKILAWGMNFLAFLIDQNQRFEKGQMVKWNMPALEKAKLDHFSRNHGPGPFEIIRIKKVGPLVRQKITVRTAKADIELIDIHLLPAT